jgi:hypothetical protein
MIKELTVCLLVGLDPLAEIQLLDCLDCLVSIVDCPMSIVSSLDLVDLFGAPQVNRSLANLLTVVPQPNIQQANNKQYTRH